MSATAHASDEHANRRRAERTRTLKHARIILNHGTSVFDCIIRDISDTGAMLFVAGQVGIPKKFELALGTAKHGHPCTVRWRADVSMGVSFDDQRPHAA